MALIDCHFYSEVLGMGTAMNVIVPEPGGSKKARRKQYPVLYLLHGRLDDESTWLRRSAIERYALGREQVIVMPAGGRSYYTDAKIGLRYWTFLSEELPRLAAHFFPISTRREDTYAAGLSMGGYGAFKLALTYPQRFAAAASLSGALDVRDRLRVETEAGNPELGWIFGAPGELAGGADDLFWLAEQAARTRRDLPRLYQWCGTEDFLYADNRRFLAHARQLGIPVDYRESPGGHDWALWDQYIEQVLQWIEAGKGT